MADNPFDRRSYKVGNFKCFASEPQGFDELKPVNVIIGRNNSGKSALLDLVQHCVLDNFLVERHLWHAGAEPAFSFSVPVSESMATAVFRPYGLGPNHISAMARSIVHWTVQGNRRESPKISGAPDLRQSPYHNLPAASQYCQALMNQSGHPLANHFFRRLAADRNIWPEPDVGKLTLDIEGRGATNIIQNYLNQAARDRTLVENRLLSALNEVFHPDANFTRILCHQLGNAGPWEIYLEEEHKGLIPLSQSGSGLKTVILVLLNLIIVPIMEGQAVSRYVFAFEELENNLHPSLLRRLLEYISKTAVQAGFLTFLTTHSSAAIDFFAQDSNAQIVHVRHDGKSATATTVKTYVENCGVLDDLDVRASDLLQANCVIWVEGPTDRIYLNRWIDLWSEGNLKEGTHYQCVFYGGRLLSHLESCPPDEAKSGVAILRLARHACVVIDSDKRNGDTPINATKQRIASEVESVGGIAWVTEGREIENYIPRAAFAKWKGWPEQAAGQPYDDVFEFLESQETDFGERYRREKPMLAEAISRYLELDACRTVLDLNEQMTKLCARIREWNGISE
jgi:putative ATP-dependent endonuclease of the OLD family